MPNFVDEIIAGMKDKNNQKGGSMTKVCLFAFSGQLSPSTDIE